MLVIVSLACTIGSQASVTEEPEVVTIVMTTTTKPEPTEAPIEEPSGATATFNQDLNVRGGPGTAYPVQEALPGGTVADIIGQNDAGTWWLISYDGKTGWVSIPYTTASNADNVPVVAAPALPSSSSSGGGSSSGSSSGGSSGGGGGSSSGGSSGSGGGAPSDSDIKIKVSIKNGSSTESSAVSYPDGDTTDRVFIEPTGFDSVKTSGNLIFTLTCSGGNAKVTYNGGSVKSGSPGCNKTWTVFFTNVSADGNLKIYLDSPGYVDWTLVVVGAG